MVLFNYSTRELTAKVVYYGPGLCGKTTNLQYIYKSLPDHIRKGKMLSLATKTDRTLFFDFLPIDLGRIRGLRTRVQLYTVPGQVFYNSTRKLVLKGADGIVFVADSQRRMLESNIESYGNLEENLADLGISLEDTPLVLQFNKRDLQDLCTIEELNSGINRYNAPFYESVAPTGIGVEDTLKAITKLVLGHLAQKYHLDKETERTAATGTLPPPKPIPQQPPAPEPVPEVIPPGASREVFQPPPAGQGSPVFPEVTASAEDVGGVVPPDPLGEPAEPEEEVLELEESQIVSPEPPPIPESGTPMETSEEILEFEEKEIDSALDDIIQEEPPLGAAPVSSPPIPHDVPPPEVPFSPEEVALKEEVLPARLTLTLQNGGELSVPLELRMEGRIIRYRLKMSLQVIAEDT